MMASKPSHMLHMVLLSLLLWSRSQEQHVGTHKARVPDLQCAAAASFPPPLLLRPPLLPHRATRLAFPFPFGFLLHPTRA